MRYRLPRFARPELVGLAVVLVGLTIVFRHRFEGDFVWDDVYYVEKNAVLTHGPLRSLFTPAMWGVAPPPAQFYRPMTMLTLWLQTWWSGLSLPAFRAGNAALHAACAFLLIAWLRQQGVGVWSAVLASAAFAFHPSMCEPVMWVMGRGDLLGTLFALAAVTVWRPTFTRASIAAVLAGFAFLSKESFVFVPLLLATNHVCLRWRAGAKLLDRGVLLVALAIAADVGVVVLRAAVGVSTASSVLSGGLVNLLRVLGTIIAHYTFQLLTWSNGATIENFRLASDARVALTWIALLSVTALLLARARRGSAAAAGMLLGLLSFVCALAPLALALPFTGMFGNRYAYFPAVGMVVILAHAAAPIAAIIERRAPRLSPVVVGALVIAIGLSGLSMSVEAVRWHDAEGLFGYDAARSPRDPKALYHYAVVIGAANGCEEATPLYLRAVEADPAYARAWHNLTGCLVNLRRYDKAVAAGQHALDLSGAPRDEYNLGVAFAGAGRRDDAAVHLERAVALEPTYAPARAALAKLRAEP